MKLLKKPAQDATQPAPIFTPDWSVKQGSLPVEIKSKSKAEKPTFKALENFAALMVEREMTFL